MNTVSLPVRPWGFITGLLLLGLMTALYGGIAQGMVVDWWNNPNYSHGFLVPFFSGYLLWQQREALVNGWSEGSWLGLPLLLGGVGTLVLGVVGAEEFLMRSSLIVILAGLVLFHGGREVFRITSFPLAFLFFMVPLPAIVFNAIAFPLQGLAASNATTTLDLLGVPVLRDGNVIHLSHITLGVTEACSGIRSLISLFAVAVVWAYLAVPGLFLQTLFVATVLPITIVANAARVVLTGLIGQWFGIEYAKGFFHSFSGWIIFVVAFLCLLGVHGLFSAARRWIGPANEDSPHD